MLKWSWEVSPGRYFCISVAFLGREDNRPKSLIVVQGNACVRKCKKMCDVAQSLQSQNDKLELHSRRGLRGSKIQTRNVCSE